MLAGLADSILATELLYDATISLKANRQLIKISKLLKKIQRKIIYRILWDIMVQPPLIVNPGVLQEHKWENAMTIDK